MGYGQEQFFRDNPILRLYWEEYCLCRHQNFIAFRKPTRDGKEVQITSVWTVGLGSLPEIGGVLEQDYLRMKLFLAFINGERQGQIRTMNRR